MSRVYASACSTRCAFHQFLCNLTFLTILSLSLPYPYAGAFLLHYKIPRLHRPFLIPRYFHLLLPPCRHLLSLSLLVASTNLIVPLTIFKFGFQLSNMPSFLPPDHPPNKKAVSPQRPLAKRCVLLSKCSTFRI